MSPQGPRGPTPLSPQVPRGPTRKPDRPLVVEPAAPRWLSFTRRSESRSRLQRDTRSGATDTQEGGSKVLNPKVKGPSTLLPPHPLPPRGQRVGGTGTTGVGVGGTTGEVHDPYSTVGCRPGVIQPTPVPLSLPLCHSAYPCATQSTPVPLNLPLCHSTYPCATQLAPVPPGALTIEG